MCRWLSDRHLTECQTPVVSARAGWSVLVRAASRRTGHSGQVWPRLGPLEGTALTSAGAFPSEVLARGPDSVHIVRLGVRWLVFVLVRGARPKGFEPLTF